VGHIPPQLHRQLIETVMGFPGDGWHSEGIAVVTNQAAWVTGFLSQWPEAEATVTLAPGTPGSETLADTTRSEWGEDEPGAAALVVAVCHWHPREERRGDVLREARRRLAPGATLIAGMPGRHGLYSLELLARMAERLLPASELPPAEVVARIANALPSGHHLRLRLQLLAELNGVGPEGLAALPGLRLESFYAVDELWAEMEGLGLHPSEWLFPARYDPSLCITEPRFRDHLSGLDEPRRSTVAELVSAGPMAHWLAAHGHAEDGHRPDFGSPDALDWRPFVMPWYHWKALGTAKEDRWVLRPFVTTELVAPATLRPWSAVLCKAADGERSVRDLLQVPEVRRAFDIPPDQWEEATLRFLEQATALRLIGLRPPAD
jgi:SAM-dependent methyltransferase